MARTDSRDPIRPKCQTALLLYAIAPLALAGCSAQREISTAEKTNASDGPRPSSGQPDPFGAASSSSSSDGRSWSPSGSSSRETDPEPSAPPPPPSAPPPPPPQAPSAVTDDVMSAPSPETAAMRARDARYSDPHRNPQSGILTAGDHDDLLNPRAYAEYAGRFLQQDRDGLPFVDTRTRQIVKVVDRDGRPVPFAKIGVSRRDGALRLVTAADGTASFYPTFDRVSSQTTVSVLSSAGRASKQIRTAARGSTTVVSLPGRAPTVKAIDIALVLDTTGSMGDEMQFLQSEIVSIVERVRRNAGNVDVNVGLIAYRDDGDDYVVQSFGIGGDVRTIRDQISGLSADGGGDTPEAMDRAMQAADRLPWREDAAKVVMLIADAPPHDEGLEPTMAATRSLRSKGVQIVPLAASGVDDTAQYVMRTMAAMTQGRYVFLTDDSGVGNAHAEPSIGCYAVTRLDLLLTRVLSAIVTGRRYEASPDEIIRTVGDMRRGRCVGEFGGQQ
jgi:Mg-chelatase subunit ChlD